MEEENKTKQQNRRRNVIRKIAATGVLGSSGISQFASLSAGSKGESVQAEEDETTVEPDMNIPAGGGSAPDGSFEEAVDETNERSNTTYDFENLDKPDSNKTDLTANDSIQGTDITVDGSPAKVTYKDCGGYSHQMVVAEVSITTEGSGGIVSYSVWLGISEDGCFYIGDAHGCVELSKTVACNANQFAENPHDHIEEWYTVANEMYSFVEEHDSQFADVAEVVVWGIITILVLFAMAVGAVFGASVS